MTYGQFILSLWPNIKYEQYMLTLTLTNGQFILSLWLKYYYVGIDIWTICGY